MLIESAFRLKKIDESDYKSLKMKLEESDGEDLDELQIINDELAQALKRKLQDRLIIGAEKIEATTDPKEKARLMNHYNNLLKELSA